MSIRCPERREDLSPKARELASLIPGVYLARNEALAGKPLLCLLEVLATPLTELEHSVAQLYDDHFVEHASPQALPRLAELVGVRLLRSDPRASRALIARIVHWRRRKGTLQTLEEILAAASGWSTEVEESFRSLLQTHEFALPMPWRGRNAVLWDPIALADPLSRRAASLYRPRDGIVERAAPLAVLPGETVTHTLRRLGRADAGRHAASPRTLDLRDWARPEVAVLRSSRFVHRERDRVQLGPAIDVASTGAPDLGLAGLTLDPLGRALPLVWRRRRLPPAATGGLTAAHEPDSRPAPTEWRFGLLTPTALAADSDGVEADDNLSLWVDGVRLIGPASAAPAGGELPFEPVGPRPVLRLADAGRPSPVDEWLLDLVAIDNLEAISAASEPGADPDPAAAGENPRLLHSRVGRGSLETTATGVADVARGGAVVALRVMRAAVDRGYRRAADGAWSELPVAVGRGDVLSPLVALDDAGTPVFARFERIPGGGLGVATWREGDAQWALNAVDQAGLDPQALPVLDAAKSGPALGAISDDARLLLVATAGASGRMAVWQVDGVLAANPVAARLDQGSGPEPRLAPSVVLHDDEIVLFGGELDGQACSDLWTMPLAGSQAGQWRARRVRNRQARIGAQLVSTAAGVLLLGGAERPGALHRDLFRIDLGRARPSWQALSPLPIEGDLPGVLWARAMAGGGLEALTWADRTAPQILRWEAADDQWSADDPHDEGAPNPPADGEALFVDQHFFCLAPPPLPPSEIVFRVGGAGHLAFLPAIDLVRDDVAQLHFLQRDGASRRWFAPGIEAGHGTLRLGAGRHAPDDRRSAPALRVGVPGRLEWQPLRLLQRSLGSWERLLALTLEEGVALDPRLGRILLRAELVAGEVAASHRVAGGAALGPDFLPDSRMPSEDWLEPVDLDDPGRFEVPVPPERDQDQVGGPSSLTAAVDPPRAGGVDTDGTPRVADLVEALAQASSPDPAARHTISVRGSPRLTPADLALGEQSVLSLFREPGGGFPQIAAAGGVSLALRRRLDTELHPDRGPTCFLSGLWLEGAVQIALLAGVIDLRWCDVGGPGAVGLRIAGAGHQSRLTLRSLPETRLVVRLFGCRLGPIVVPPWVQLIAAGCLFDAGDSEAPAISAPGARLRLRHCTVHGGTRAGLLEASSCAFKGRVEATRDDLGWLRYSLLAGGGRLPVAFNCRSQPISFVSRRPTDPDYLMLAENNGQSALIRGERGRIPGAHGERSARLTELYERGKDFLPLGLVARHQDRTRAELDRMHRRTT